jgi:hypothetical protein
MKTIFSFFLIITLITSCSKSTIQSGFKDVIKTNSLSVEKDSNITTDSIKIGAIVSNPEQYEWKIFTIECKYGGWGDLGFNCDTKNLALKSRSDVLVYDETGCIYKSGAKIIYQEKKLKPKDKSCIGSKLIIKGMVKLIDGKPYLGNYQE